MTKYKNDVLTTTHTADVQLGEGGGDSGASVPDNYILLTEHDLRRTYSISTPYGSPIFYDFQSPVEGSIGVQNGYANYSGDRAVSLVAVSNLSDSEYNLMTSDDLPPAESGALGIVTDPEELKKIPVSVLLRYNK